ncbi:MAG TPA: AI-2E family transporter [Chthonomonadaceae bacterium]|nr:AI-2E family transporter [Chthonomonadaceae bacterium]
MALQRVTHEAETRSGHLSETVRMDQWLRLLVVLAACLLILLAVAVAVRLLAFIGHTLLIFSLGGLMAYALEPLVQRARARKGRPALSRGAGVGIVYGAILLIGAAAVALLSGIAVRQVAGLVRDHAKLEADGRRHLAKADLWLQERNMHLKLEETLAHPPPNVRSWGEAAAHTTLHVVGEAGKMAVESIIVVLISVYFLIYCTEMREGFNRALPVRLQPYAEQWENDVSRIVGGFVRGQLMLALVMGTAAAIGCALLGVRFWLLIGIFVVIASLIPVLGPYIGAAPAVISAALSPPHVLHPVGKVIVVILLFFVISEAGSKILYPRLVGKALGLHEVLVLFVLFAGLEIGGLVGVLFAAPLTALIATTVVQLHRLWIGAPPVSVADLARGQGPIITKPSP